MESGKVFDTGVLSWQAARELKQASHFLMLFFPLFGLHAAILSRTNQKVTSLPFDVLQQTKDISPTISHMNPLRFGQGRTDGLHGSFPNQRFPITLEPLGVRFALGNWLPDKGFFIGQSEHFRCLGIDRQHGLHEKPLCFLAATDWPQSLRFGVLRVVQISHVLHQQHLLALPGLLTGVLPMGFL
jgi:hypothetical protein